MAIQSSAQVVRDMKASLGKTVKEIEAIKQSIQNARNSTSGWNDSQGQQYAQLMRRVAQLTDSPVSTLKAAAPKLEKLAQALDSYSRVRF